MFEPSKLDWAKDFVKPLEAARAKPYTLEHLAEWLEKQPRAGEYEFFKCDGMCMFGQYMTSLGIREFSGNYLPALEKFSGAWQTTQRLAYDRPRTFGAALERTRAAIKARA